MLARGMSGEYSAAGELLFAQATASALLPRRLKPALYSARLAM